MNKSRAFLVLVAGFALVIRVIANGQGTIRVSEASLRKAAVKIVTPEYPEDSKKARATGVAVASVGTDTSGNVESVEIVEAPDSSIKKAVDSAVRQWRFGQAFAGGKPVKVLGKLTFYYIIDSDGARVENPKTFTRVQPK
ncbi:MAG TPA: energy transducer TonB [Blastocatellia bacterium]|nr:energy transducer TonB [Blastocatellia bacterium]